jgi:hypothetical protein
MLAALGQMCLMNFRFGSLAALQSKFSPMSAFGRIADVSEQVFLWPKTQSPVSPKAVIPIMEIWRN